MEDYYYTDREQEIRLSRLALLRVKLKEAAHQLEHWRLEEQKLYRLLQNLEGDGDETIN